MRTRDLALLTGGFLFFSAILFALLALMRSYIYWFDMDDYTILDTSQILAYLLSFLIVPKAIRYISSDINIKNMRKIRSYAYIGISFAILLITYLIAYKTETNQESLGFHPTLWITFSIIIVTPLFEELLFRGVLLKFLYEKKGKLVAIGASSLIFALLHGGNLLFYICFGAVLSFLKFKTNSLMCSYVCHAAWNGVAMFIVFY